MRGYVSAMRKGAIVNLTYVWDVVDAQGQRVDARRRAKRRCRPAPTPNQPWSAVTPAASRMLALKTMGEIGRWAKSNAGGAGRSNLAAGNSGMSAAGAGAAGAGVGAASLAPAAAPVQ